MSMISSELNTVVMGTRQLQIDFDLYTEGDVAFRKELAAMMAASIDEFQAALHRAIDNNDPVSFGTASHKAKAVLLMINDAEYLALTQNIKNRLTANSDQQSLQPMVSAFDDLSRAIAASLRIVAIS